MTKKLDAEKTPGEKRRAQTIRKRGSLYDRDKKLAAEWDAGAQRCTHEGGEQRASKEISGGGGRDKGYWVCADCGHYFPAAVRDRMNKGSGCPSCYEARRGQMPLECARSVIQSDPRLLEEYCAEINGSLDDLSVRMNEKIYWKCSIPRHDPFPAPVKDRRSREGKPGSRCPSCATISLSPIQASITEYLRHVLKEHHYEVLGRERVLGGEADIYIPDLRCIIEIDGYPWHDGEDVIERDRNKSKVWKDEQLTVLRLRDSRLRSEPLQHDFIALDRVEINNLESCCMTILRLINELDLDDRRLVESLQQILQKGLAAGELSDFYYTQPQPPNGESLADKCQNLCRFWSSTNPVGPEQFYPASNQVAEWVCPICGEDYPQEIAQRVKVDNRTGRPRLTHRKCCQWIRHAANAQAIRDWILADEGPAILPDELRRGMKPN